MQASHQLYADFPPRTTYSALEVRSETEPTSNEKVVGHIYT
ncbi:hypothetical protein [Nostoc sp. FACHB-892]|nr:hypothetical protein [Nostoc sp. FACHB-892]